MMNSMNMVAGMNVGAVAINGGVGVVELRRPAEAVDHAVETVKELSADVLANAHITLRELKQKIASTVDVDLPSFKQLIAMASPVVAQKEVSGAKLTVYENGFASYEADNARTVLAVDRCGDYRYQYDDSYEIVPAEVFEESEWAVRLVMEGERRIEFNRARNHARNETDIQEYGEQEMEMATMVDFMEEQNREMLADEELKRLYAAIGKLTERQQQIIQLYYFKGMTMPEIADELGISFPAVHYSIQGALKKLKKVF